MRSPVSSQVRGKGALSSPSSLSDVPIRNRLEPGFACVQRPNEFLHRSAPMNYKGKGVNDVSKHGYRDVQVHVPAHSRTWLTPASVATRFSPGPTLASPPPALLPQWPKGDRGVVNTPVSINLHSV